MWLDAVQRKTRNVLNGRHLARKCPLKKQTVDEDVAQFCADMESLRRSYHLNGEEVQQVWMAVLRPDWHYVRGTWSPMGDPVGLPAVAQVLAHDSG